MIYRSCGPKKFLGILLFCSLGFPLFLSCKAFMHGYTEDKALNAYYLITGRPDEFGDRRLRYNMGFHHHSALSAFLESGRTPAFIYEYKTPDKRRGIRLFYPQADSVYVFEEPSKGNLRSLQKEARKMDDYERMTFERLRSGK